MEEYQDLERKLTEANDEIEALKKELADINRINNKLADTLQEMIAFLNKAISVLR